MFRKNSFRVPETKNEFTEKAFWITLTDEDDQ